MCNGLRKASHKLLVLLFLIVFSYCNASFALTETIVIFRHGEKPKAGLGQIDCQGLNRAIKLPKVLNDKFGRPNYIFAPDPKELAVRKEKYHYVRALAAVLPTAIQMNLPVNTQFTASEHLKLAETLLAPQYKNALIYISWEHLNGYLLARDIFNLIKANPNVIPWWPSNDYDSLYVIKIKWDNAKPIASFSHQYQKLDGLSKDCPLPNTTQTDLTKPYVSTQKIIFIPEAESSELGLGQLSCLGLNRALALNSALGVYGKADKYITPDPLLGLIEENQHAYHYTRAFMTIEPTAIKNVMYLETKFGYKDVAAVKDNLMENLLKNKTVIVAWEARELVNLIKIFYSALGASPDQIPDTIPEPSTIYIVTVTDKFAKVKPSFEKVILKFPPLSPTCPEPIK